MDLIIFILLGDTKRWPERSRVWGALDRGGEVVSYTRSSKSVMLSHCTVRYPVWMNYLDYMCNRTMNL